MKKFCVGLFVLAIIIPCYAAEFPKTIILKNNIVFDHEGHKGDCISCHESLAGASKIVDFGKEWAHKTCKGCHSSMGIGPTDCFGCHQKK
jgi:hypothetical protein